jgi:hypothetical protein
MRTFNYKPFIIINGFSPSKYEKNEFINGCKKTIEIIAHYNFGKKNQCEKWHYVFNVFVIPTVMANKIESWLSCFSRFKIE